MNPERDTKPAGSAPAPRGRPSRRSMLLSTAIRVLQERGIRNMTLEEVCAASGVSRGAVYWHFRSKECLVEESLAATTLPLEQLRRESWEDPCATLARAVMACVTQERLRGLCVTLLFNASEPAARARMARVRVAVTWFLARHCVARREVLGSVVRRHRIQLAHAMLMGSLIEFMAFMPRDIAGEHALAQAFRRLVGAGPTPDRLHPA